MQYQDIIILILYYSDIMILCVLGTVLLLTVEASFLNPGRKSNGGKSSDGAGNKPNTEHDDDKINNNILGV